MCYEPLRFSPIFRRFVNSRESRVGLPLTPLNLTTKSVCALAQSSLFCGVCLIALRSLAHSHKQHPPLCVFYTHSLPNKTPLSSRAQPRGWKSPRGTSTKPNSRTASGCRSHAYSPLSDISRSSSTLEGVLSSLPLVVCVLSRMSSEREGARAPVALLLVLFGCLSSNYGDPTERSSYREAPIILSDPLSLIVTDLKRPHHSTCRSL